MDGEAHRGQIAGTRWDPHQYLKFADHRLRPALELLARVPLAAPAVVYDLGCGPGDVTRLIAERWPNAQITGVDNSPQMIAQAASAPSPVRWLEGDVRTWQPTAPPDLVFSNATMQWVGEHETLFPRLVRCLRPGGCLAIQMPLSWGAPSHRLMRETLANGGPGGGALGTDELRAALGRNWVADAATYYDLLAPRTTSLDVWETEYLQVLDGPDPVLEWVKGTGLRPVLETLAGAERDRFVAEYTRRLREAYPARPDGRTLYPFRRLFLVAAV